MRLPPEEVREHVHLWLLAPERELPEVVITTRHGRTLVEPGALARRLGGRAQVAASLGHHPVACSSRDRPTAPSSVKTCLPSLGSASCSGTVRAMEARRSVIVSTLEVRRVETWGAGQGRVRSHPRAGNRARLDRLRHDRKLATHSVMERRSGPRSLASSPARALLRPPGRLTGRLRRPRVLGWRGSPLCRPSCRTRRIPSPTAKRGPIGLDRASASRPAHRAVAGNWSGRTATPAS